MKGKDYENDVRIGSVDESGSYKWWVHLKCWRVPSRSGFGMNPKSDDPKDV
jgi:hypothetical protein